MAILDTEIKNTLGGMFVGKTKMGSKRKEEVSKSKLNKENRVIKYSQFKSNIIRYFSSVNLNRSSAYTKSVGDNGISRSSLFTLDVGSNKMNRSSTYTFDLSNTWWKKTPTVGLFFLKLLFIPLVFLKNAADFILSLLISSIFIIIGLWYFEIITDELVVSVFQTIGDRGLSILSALGVPI